MGRELTEAQFYKYKIAKMLAEIVVSEFKKEDTDCLNYFLNSIVNECKTHNADYGELFTAIHNNLADRIMGPRTPQEFYQAYGSDELDQLPGLVPLLK